MIANTPKPPYYCVVFTSLVSNNISGYGEMAQQMLELAAIQPGYLGIESAREKVGITVSYWKDLESIKNWKANSKHLVAQKYGKEKWYSDFSVRIAKVEHDYSKNN
ncbi:antibiotic biosynthesis monooxygenase [Kangiella sp. HZ709]|uniref:antibiotic biosynthesis monooxygenase family protein n=1 Tax=Kangiella sp. HZ709 TaxID=2666328 RepID=UPI0012B03768|nr:antibiotic biosynthesis monooxygenase [Kangiella sp. HZ709]MRX26631.1 antibiotic biosynthesis monooxygenase [Kangiella sp. HZ709]